jgi:hypothetical protein
MLTFFKNTFFSELNWHGASTVGLPMEDSEREQQQLTQGEEQKREKQCQQHGGTRQTRF